jgi:hypothetical protein
VRASVFSYPGTVFDVLEKEGALIISLFDVKLIPHTTKI